MQNVIRRDPFPTFRFWVEIDGLYVGGFSEVSGLQAETEYESYEEGGFNGFVHYLPTRTKYSPLVLKRGMTHSRILWEWYDAVVTGNVQRKSGSIVLKNEQDEPICSWYFRDAYPTKWTGPTLNASANDIAVEEIELVHHGLKAKFTR